MLRSAFSETLVQDGTVSDPITIAPNHSVVLRVTNHTAEQTLPLDKVREKVIAAVHADRTKKSAVAAADALLARVQKGETLQSLAAAEKLQVTPIPGLPRTAPVPTPAANRAIFSAPRPTEGKPSVGKVELTGGRYAVFVVSKSTPGDLKQMPAEQQTMLREQLSQIDGGNAAQAYVKEMRKRYKIQIEEAQL